MTELTITFDCASCWDETTIPMDEQEEHRVDDQLYCEGCIGATAWESQDFPLWIEMESYNDHYELGRLVERETGIDLEDIPISRELKYEVFYVYWKITEDGVEGPYDEKRGELL